MCVNFRRSNMLLILLSVLLASCAFPAAVESTVAPSSTLILSSETDIPPTITETFVPPTVTATATTTATLEPTATFTVTPSPVPPSLLVNTNAVCRVEPDVDSPVAGYLVEGAMPEVSGVVEGELNWWLIQFEDGEACWISDNVVTLAGEIASLPRLSPTVTPTETSPPPTITNTPAPPTVTASITPSPTLEPTPTFTITPTVVPPSLSVDTNAVCRTGPDINYPIAGYLETDATLHVSGMVEGELSWFLIQLEDGKDCWIADSVVTLHDGGVNVPRITPPPTPTPEVMASSQLGKTDFIYYFLTATDTGGPFGCETGDSLLYIETSIPRTGELEVDVVNALNALFSNHNQYYNGLYNPMYASSLRATDVDFVPGDVEAQVWLRGDLARPKDKCDSQRMRDQVWETIEIQFPEINHAVIRVNRALLGDLLVVNK
ncbi:MAG: hypothetical protein H8E28_00745 [Anaerolineae bacterium]|nr:hypothetical protein [Anaerolineae bacterium]